MKAARSASAPALELFLDRTNTPLGELIVVADQDGRLRLVGFTDGHPRIERELEAHGSVKRSRAIEISSCPRPPTTGLRRKNAAE